MEIHSPHQYEPSQDIVENSPCKQCDKQPGHPIHIDSPPPDPGTGGPGGGA